MPLQKLYHDRLIDRMLRHRSMLNRRFLDQASGVMPGKPGWRLMTGVETESTRPYLLCAEADRICRMSSIDSERSNREAKTAELRALREPSKGSVPRKG